MCSVCLWFLDMIYRRLWFLDMTDRRLWFFNITYRRLWFLDMICRRILTIMEQKQYTRPANLSSHPLSVISCFSIFDFLWRVSWTIVCLSIVFLLAIVLFLRSHTDSEYYFGIFKISRWNPQISKGSELCLCEVLGNLEWRKKRKHIIFVNLQKKLNYITWIFKYV